MRTHMVTRHDRQLAETLDAWVDQGLLDRAQAERILAAEKAGPPHRLPRPAASAGPARIGPDSPSASLRADRETPSGVGEATGYVGGAFVVTASMLLGARYWDGISVLGRVLLALCGAFALLAAGAAVPAGRGAAASRLRSVLWLGSAGAGTAFLALVAQWDGDWPGDRAGLIAGAGGAAYGTALWTRHRTAPTLVAILAPLLLAAGSAGAMADGHHTPAVLVWAAGVLFAALGAAGVLTPRRWAGVLAAIGALVAADTTATSRGGLVLAVATALVVVAAAVVVHDLLLLGAGVAGTVVLLPFVVDRWFGGIESGAPVLLLAGGALIGAAVYTSRTQRP